MYLSVFSSRMYVTSYDTNLLHINLFINNTLNLSLAGKKIYLPMLTMYIMYYLFTHRDSIYNDLLIIYLIHALIHYNSKNFFVGNFYKFSN